MRPKLLGAAKQYFANLKAAWMVCLHSSVTHSKHDHSHVLQTTKKPDAKFKAVTKLSQSRRRARKKDVSQLLA